MTTDIASPGQTENLYEELAKAVDRVHDGAKDDMASEYEAQFLIKLAFLALRDIRSPERQRHLIEVAERDLG